MLEQEVSEMSVVAPHSVIPHSSLRACMGLGSEIKDTLNSHQIIAQWKSCPRDETKNPEMSGWISSDFCVLCFALHSQWTENKLRWKVVRKKTVILDTVRYLACQIYFFWGGWAGVMNGASPKHHDFCQNGLFLYKNAFLGRPNWFFELSQSNKKPYFDQIFSAAVKFLKKKTGQKGVCRGIFWKKIDQKIVFVGARSLLNFSIYWRQRRLKKNFRVCHPKMDITKYYKGGPFVSNPLKGRPHRRLYLNPPLTIYVHYTVSAELKK